MPPLPLHPSVALPAGTRLGRVTLQVADIDRSLSFYEQVLGLQVVERSSTDGGRYVALAAHGSREVLVGLREKPGARPVPTRGLLGLYHFAILLPSRGDLGAFLRHAIDNQVPFGAAEHGVSEALYLVDPDGLTVEVYRDRPRDEWTRRDGQILAVTEPLDADGLLTSAAGYSWQGTPAGTTIGHVHFFVGDLDAAGRFYADGLGFERRFWSMPGVLFVAAGDYHHHVGLNTWARRAPRATTDDAKLVEWEILVPETTALEPMAARLRQMPSSSIEATTESLTASDPWGITVRVRPAGER